MLFSRDLYKVGARCPFVYGRQEVKGAAASATASSSSSSSYALYFTGLFANATNISELPRVSPWHAIMTRPSAKEPLVYNYVNEIPLHATETNIGMSVSETFNPIRRFSNEASATVAPIPFNYGCLPRTFCDAIASGVGPAEGKKSTTTTAADAFSAPVTITAVPNTFGDGSAVDVIELSESSLPIGMASQVRVLGAFAMTRPSAASSASQSRTVLDWKIIVSNTDDENLLNMSNVSEKRLADIQKWLVEFDAVSKGHNSTAAAKKKGSLPKSTLAFNGKVFGDSIAVGVIDHYAAAYNKLRAGSSNNNNNSVSKASVWIPDASANPALMAASM